ncbi:MAG: dienelactone hydrolase family protein [Candidatus Rokubacteria bacterium]|nr:dienelactone hydrolase family protein [Candidatus Rokubacteria bacterium]
MRGRLLVATALLLAGCAAGVKTVAYQVAGGVREALECRPPGAGPFPAVVFNHGSIVDGHGYAGASRVGYRLDRFCEALAAEGWLAYAPIREPAPRGRGFDSYEDVYVDIVAGAIDSVKRRRDVDKSRIALMGFSMGGLVSLRTSLGRNDLAALVLLAPAAGRGIMQSTLDDVARVAPPVLVMVEAGDSPHILNGVDNLTIALRSRNKDVKVIRYDRGGGHQLFYDVTYWWPDARTFLADKLKPRPGGR